MARTPNIYGGGAKTNVNGLNFERETDLRDALERMPGITFDDITVNKNGEPIGLLLEKHNLYNKYLESKGVDWKNILSKKLLPDEAFLSYKNNSIIVVEKKYQQVEGSVDEKLQTCGFKKEQYEKLFKGLGLAVVYVYVLNDWFKKPSYKDVLKYIQKVGCHYYFNSIPLNVLGLD